MKNFTLAFEADACVSEPTVAKETMDGCEPTVANETMDDYETSESVEDAALVLQESAAEGDALIDVSDEASQIAQTLDNMSQGMADANETEGGITPAVASALNAAVEHFTRRLGAPPRRIIPALEAFGGTQSRHASTSVALEGLKDMVKRILTAIVAAFKRMMEWITGFFRDFQVSTKRLIARAKAVSAAADKIDSKSGSGAVVLTASKSEVFIKHLLVDGLPVKAPEFTSLFTKLMTESGAELKTLHEGLSSFSNKSRELITLVSTPGGTEVGPVNLKITGVLVDVSKAIIKATDDYNSSSNDTISLPEGTQLIEYRLPFGSVSKFCILPQQNLEPTKVLAALNGFKMFIGSTTDAKEPAASSADVQCLDSQQIKAIAKSVIDNMSSNLIEKKAIETLNKISKDFDELNKYFTTAENLSPVSETVARVSSCLSKVVGVYGTSFIANSLRYEAAMSKSALDYAAASLKVTSA
jgi:hypothetical protein